MKSLEIRGGEEVTGSQFLLTGNNRSKFLIDCGLSQKNDKNPGNTDLDPTNLKGVFITHAHIDHVGLVQQLVRFPEVPIYMTPATLSIANISLRNSEKISPSLFPPGSIDKIMKRTTTVPYGRRFEVDGAKAIFRNAGHILGSASLELSEGGDIVAFSGDIGDSPSRTVKPAEYIKEADIIVMEATYGGIERQEHNSTEDIREAIRLARKNKGDLLVPVFAIDRAQSFLSELRKLSEEGFLKTMGMDVFFSSPMASDVTRIYNGNRDLLNEKLAKIIRPFAFPELRETYTHAEDLMIEKQKDPKIIVAGSGMMAGGRIIEHAKRCLPDERNVMLFTGFQAPGTTGEKILRGDKTVKLDGEDIEVKAQILFTSLSAHADQNGLLSWLEYPHLGQRPVRNTIVVHGETVKRHAFANSVKERFGLTTTVPDSGDIISFS